MGIYTSACYMYYGPGTVRQEEIQITCGEEDIIVKIRVCGRCGTDRRLFRKAHPRVKTPVILGHELVGEIVETGKKVKDISGDSKYNNTGFKKGERVTVQPRIAHQYNGLMLMKDPVQNLSYYIHGAYSQYMKITPEIIKAGGVIRVPENVSDEEAALTEPAACALESIFSTPHAVGTDREGRHVFRSGIKPGGRTLIIGSGTLAAVCGVLAKLEQAGQVWFLMRSKQKKDLIKSLLGNWPRFKIVEDYSDLDLHEKKEIEAGLERKFLDVTDGELFDDIILACSSKDAHRLMFQLLNPYGYGVASFFAGLHETSEDVNTDLLHYRIAKATGMSGCTIRTMKTVTDWMRTGKMSLKGFVCPNHYTLSHDPEEFFTTKADGRKPMLYPWE